MGIVTPYWDRFRSLTTIRNLLKLVYVDDEKLDDELVRNIRAPTDHPVASSTFASVLWSPKPKVAYDDALDVIRDGDVPVALVYGREDPWVTPLWGQRLKRRVPNATYYEVSKCGHCPHHEALELVNEIMGSWMTATSAGEVPPREPVTVVARGGSTLLGEVVDGNPRLPTEWLVYCIDALSGGSGRGLRRR